jgi:excisionase family DNA binding protein
MMTIKVAAERLSVSEKTIRNLVKSGRLGHHRIGAGRGVIRISEESLDRHLAECEVRENDSPTTPRRTERRKLRHINL